MATLSSTARSINQEYAEAKRIRGENNIGWLKPHWREDRVGLLLVGGTSLVDFRLRVAQSHLRSDLTPSHWSHVALLGESDGTNLATAPLQEISLSPAGGFGFPPASNGVQNAVLERYANPKQFP